MIHIGVQFSNMNEKDGSYTLSDAIFGAKAVEGDSIFTFDGNAWNLNQADYIGEGLGWAYYPADGGDDEIVTGIKIPKGDLLYFTPADKTATTQVPVAGQVAATGEQSVKFTKTDTNKVFPLCNPFPIDTTWGDLNTFTKENDSIYVLDQNAWNLDQYDRLADGEGWAYYPANGDDEIINDESAIAIPAGDAVYYAPTESVTWTVTL